MKRVLITGGAGFIGRHLCRELVGRGYAVRSLDLRTPSEKITGVEERQGDVLVASDLMSALSDVHAVVHLAAIVSVPVCEGDPVESHRTNFLGTVAVTSAIQKEQEREGHAISLVFASSAAVYGDPGLGSGAISETQPAAPKSHYGLQKHASEQAIGLSTQISAIALRFFNVFGPGQDPTSPYSGVIARFAEKSRRGETLSLFGGGEQTRDFIHVTDVARACADALRFLESAKPPVFHIFNVGTGVATSVRTLAEAVIAQTPKSVSITPAPARAGDILHSRADVAAIARVLNWRAQVPFAEGLKSLLRSLENMA